MATLLGQLARYVRPVIRVDAVVDGLATLGREHALDAEEVQESMEAEQAMGRNGGKLSVVCLQAACGQPYAVGLVATLSLNLP